MALFLVACQSAIEVPQRLSPGEDYLITTSFDTERSSVSISIEALASDVCVNPSDWPVSGGKISSIDNPILIRRGDETFFIKDVYVDAAFGIELKVKAGESISSQIPLDEFDGITEWLGNEQIVYSPRVSTCA